MTTERSMSCPDCKAQMSIHLIKGGKRYCGHCPGCGRLEFGPAELLARLGAGALSVCDHGLELKPCKRGFTSWCPMCRIRAFTYPEA